MKLTNTGRTGRVFNLPHDSYCRARRACSCRRVPAPNVPGRRSGAGRLACASVRIGAGETVDVSVAVRAVPEIDRAIRLGELRAD